MSITATDRRARAGVLAILAILALAGALMLAWGTGPGIGLQPDSAFYIDCAFHLLRGDGYATTVQDYLRPISFETYAAEMASGGVRARPEVVFPPLYSYVLAAGRAAGLDPFRAARALGALLFAANAFLAGFVVYRFTAPSRLFAFAAAVLMLGSESTLGLHAYALSEPLFLFLTLLALFALSRFVEKGGVPDLVVGGLAVGLAFLTRYAGGALVATAVLAILVFRRTGLRRRLVEAAAMGMLGCLPTAAFMVRNLLAAGAATNRTPALFSLTAGNFGQALKATVSSWVFPNFYRALAASERDLLALVSLALLAAVIAAAVVLLRRTKRSGGERFAVLPAAAAPFAVFLPVYTAYILVSVFFIDPEIPLDYRILAPFFVAGVVAGAIALSRISRALRPGRARTALAIAFGLYLAGYLAVGAAWIIRFRSHSGGYNNLEWRSAEIREAGDAVKAMPPGTPILTNDNGAVYFLFWRDAYHVPVSQWPARIAELKSGIGGGGAIVVLFKTRMHLLREDMSPEAIERLLGERLAAEPVLLKPTVSVFRIRGGR